MGKDGKDGATYDLELVLPKLLLLRLIQKRKVADMLDEDVPQDGELGFLRRHFALLRLERRAEALQRRGGIELADLPFDLVGNEFSLQVCAISTR